MRDELGEATYLRGKHQRPDNTGPGEKTPAPQWDGRWLPP